MKKGFKTKVSQNGRDFEYRNRDFESNGGDGH